jgi:hypothetical protein
LNFIMIVNYFSSAEIVKEIESWMGQWLLGDLCHLTLQEGVHTVKVEGSLNSEINPMSPLGDTKEEMSSVPLQCRDVKVEVMASYIIVILINKIIKQSTQQFLHNKHSYNEICHFSHRYMFRSIWPSSGGSAYVKTLLLNYYHGSMW